jgi:hypothetical protein
MRKKTIRLRGSQTSAILARAGGTPERNLWLAVVGHVIENDPPAELERWLSSRDGREVCRYAGLEPTWVLDRFGGGAAVVHREVAA